MSGVVMKKWRIALVMSLFGLSAGAHAGTVQGTVSHLSQRASDGLIYVIINGTATGQPACATHNYWIIKAENTEAGKKQFALLTTAFESGSQVILRGMNTCSRWNDGEDIDEVDVTN